VGQISVVATASTGPKQPKTSTAVNAISIIAGTPCAALRAFCFFRRRSHVAFDWGKYYFLSTALQSRKYDFEKDFSRLQISPFFLRFAAGIADNHFHDETTNHDSRRCGLPGDWVLFCAVGADDSARLAAQ
jgi:hypothetical protein